MQKMLRYCLMLGIGASLIAFTGCTKLFDYIKEHPDEDNTSCRITKILSISPFDTITAVVAYNAWGDPVSVTPNSIGTGNTQRLFRYDSKHRLTDYIGAYSNGGYEQWRRYVYDNHNRIIRDTAYGFGSLDDRTHTDYGPYITTYDYDAKGRVIHTRTLDPKHPEYPQEFFYSYDANGNLQVEGAVYDDKINFLRTNKVWMFVDRNYSVNNIKSVTAYNDKGLPLKLNNEGFYYISFLGFYGISLELTYKCN